MYELTEQDKAELTTLITSDRAEEEIEAEIGKMPQDKREASQEWLATMFGFDYEPEAS